MPKISIRLSLLACIATLVWTSAVLADGSSLPYGGGGAMAKFDAIIGQYNASGELFRIEGHCQSSCTMFLAIRNVCVDPNANLLFHASLSARERDHAPYPEKNAHMASRSGRANLRAFVLANHYMDSFTFHPDSVATSFVNLAIGNVLKSEEHATQPPGWYPRSASILRLRSRISGPPVPAASSCLWLILTGLRSMRRIESSLR